MCFSPFFSKQKNDRILIDKNIRLGWDSNQRPHAPKANIITTELKRVLPNTVYRYCI